MKTEYKIIEGANRLITTASLALAMVSTGVGINNILDYNNERAAVFSYSLNYSLNNNVEFDRAYRNAAFAASFVPTTERDLGLMEFGIAGILLGTGGMAYRRRNSYEKQQEKKESAPWEDNQG